MALIVLKDWNPVVSKPEFNPGDRPRVAQDDDRGYLNDVSGNLLPVVCDGSLFTSGPLLPESTLAAGRLERCRFS